ncbi:MAG: hypothetical protein HY360_18745 [Verrucomicrobia bacterium]|nr:hypothetical protein [Verrucomicrobiota bacterium]
MNDGIVLPNHPEKTVYLGQVFDDRATSYKFFWFLAILSLAEKESANALRMADLFTEMAALAWHPVCLYRLSLGGQDTLQNAVREIQRTSTLEPDATSAEIRRFVEESVAARVKLNYFKRHVPTRFLTPWFRENLRGVVDSRRDALIARLAKESQQTALASPYWFDCGSIRLNDSWRGFFVENRVVVQSFAEHHLALYLQARNPNVPGVVNKLRARPERQLAAAHQFWRIVRTDFEKPAEFQDIYSGRPLADSFSIDHFLPWSFVVHDLLWNLTPVAIDPPTNSLKSDRLPDLDLYLPRLAKLHFAAIKIARKQPRLLEDYTDCFKQDVPRLLALGEDGLEGKYREVIVPQTQIAINLGFKPGWKWKMPSGTIELFSPKESAEEEAIPPKVQQVSSAESKPQLPVITASHEPEDVISPESVIVQFPERAGKEFRQKHLPYYSLKVAAGGFIAGDAPDPEGWVNVVRLGFSRRSFKGMFATRVVGKSMEPTINDGALCVFRNPVEGSRQGRVVLVKKRHFSDPETGGNFTVKRYRSTKVIDENSWRHDAIELIPDNPDRQKYPVIRLAPEDCEDLQVIAEFVAMLDLKSEKL